jgi:glycosyltransferase involved in cell wall biosynthesis
MAIANTIQSVLTQSFQDFEIIIADDGSTDNTKEVIASFKDARIHYYYQENRGVCAARNLAIAYASGSYIVFLDSDDVVLTDWLSGFYQYAFNQITDLVFCDMKLINLEKKTEKIVHALYPFRPDEYSENGLFLSGTFSIKRDLLIKLNGFDENIKFGEFTELSLRCNQLNPVKKFTNKISFIYHASNTGGAKNLENRIHSHLYLLKKHQWFFQQYPDVKILYYRNIGVSYARLREWHLSRIYLFKSYIKQPLKLNTLGSFIISCFPILAKRFWKTADC